VTLPSLLEGEKIHHGREQNGFPSRSLPGISLPIRWAKEKEGSIFSFLFQGGRREAAESNFVNRVFDSYRPFVIGGKGEGNLLGTRGVVLPSERDFV